MNFREARAYLSHNILDKYALSEAKHIARIIFEDIFGTQDEESEFERIEELEDIIQRLNKNEPVQYISGRTMFYGHWFKVNKHVLIPRPETEELVRWILEDARSAGRQMDVLDIGSGSGCIGVTLKKELPSLRVFSVEYSLDALNVGRINSRRLRAPVEFYRLNFLDKDMWAHLGKFDIIVSNPPYISQKDSAVMADNVLLYEPEMALFPPGDDPLLFYRRIQEFSEDHLKDGGIIYVELNEFYVDDIKEIFSGSGQQKVEIQRDMQGRQRMMKVSFAAC